MTEVDELWSRIPLDGERAFGQWAGRVERPVRLYLRPWAASVDVECIVQEALLRMWLRANDDGAEPLTGENASLRFCCRVAWNLARNESRKRARETVTDPQGMPEVSVGPEEPSSPGLRQAIADCVQALGEKLRSSLLARLEDRGLSGDVAIAESLAMTKNTFLQNIVRARKQVAACLGGKGVAIEEMVR
jgi:DNA-directed RNA polymerase specialized sigma24 family protein